MSALHFEVASELLCNCHVVLSLIQCFVHHILYMRGLMPAPYRNLLADVLQVDRDFEENGKKLSSSQKKNKIFVTQVTNMMDGVRSVLDVTLPSSFTLIFGPSATNMKEVFTLEFVHNEMRVDNAALVSRTLDRMQRQLLLKLVEFTSQEDFKTLPPTNIFCALKLRRGNTEYIDSEKVGGVSATFVVKDVWKLKVNKRGPPPMIVKICAPVPVFASADVDAEVEYERCACAEVVDLTLDDLSCSTEVYESVEEPTDYWLVLKKGIKSLRSVV